MPEISRFFGSIITMTLRVLGGRLSPRVRGLIDELLEDWRLACESAPLKRIAPLG